MKLHQYSAKQAYSLLFLAAISIGLEMNFSDDVMRRALANFAGVKRRFTKTGEANGVTVIDDYGHHPVEISAVLSAAL